MEITFFQIDAFTSRMFGGNPAGVCVLDSWLPEHMLQSIAAENNLSETAFLVGENDTWELRWFTPKVEIDLCGHATLASGHALFETGRTAAQVIQFETKSGRLSVARQDNILVMDFPARRAEACSVPAGIGEIMGIDPRFCYRSRDLMLVYENEDQVRSLTPDLVRVAGLDSFAVIVTAPGEKSDFVSRFFAPAAGISEDPVTGSAHCTLIPYWSARLGKKQLHALQVSERGGELFCEDKGERVLIGGRAAMYLAGTIRV